MNGFRTTVVRSSDDITIRLTKVEYEMLKEFQKKDRRYRKGLEEKVRLELKSDFSGAIG